MSRGVAWAVGAGATAWLLRHVAAPAVRAWRPDGGTYRRLGPLSVRVAGDGPRAFVLLHGPAGCGDAFGAGYDELAAHGRLVVPDLLGFGRSMNVGGAKHVSWFESLDREASNHAGSPAVMLVRRAMLANMPRFTVPPW